MCGIVGVYDYQRIGRQPDPAVFDAMVDALAHRGPDGRGTWYADGLALGHRRLAVIDPTATGAQPMHDRRANCVVTFNGEIYNYRELRNELSAAGHVFKTDGDTEVLLAAYAEWGTSAVYRLNGIFAFALWDDRRKRLWLVRDRLGVKPLYYSTADGMFRFGSEVQALLADPGFVRRPSRDGINAFLSFGFIPSPLTGFDGLCQLPPAHQMFVKNGRVTTERYWSLSMCDVPLADDEAQRQFAQQFRTAVSRQLVSDVPIGAFLSGGVDSAAIASEMSGLNCGPVQAFSVGFDQASFDESAAAAETANRIGVELHQAGIDFNLPRTFDEYSAHCAEPFADSSALAVYHLCRFASGNVKVALSGDGADELLGGYSTYRATQLAATYRKLPGWSRRLMRRAVDAWPASDQRYSLQQFASRFVLGAEEGPGRDFASWRVHWRSTDKQRVCRRDFLDGGDDPIELYANQFHVAPGASSLLKRMLFADLTFYLPNDMLAKVDRMSMAHGLEVRVPFLDHKFVEFCARLPSHQLARLRFPTSNKRILRKHLAARVGRDIAGRRKTGFNIPVEAAMRGCLRQRFVDAVNTTRFRQDGPFDVDQLIRTSERHAAFEIDSGHALFSALVLAEWWNRWLSPPVTIQTNSTPTAQPLVTVPM